MAKAYLLACTLILAGCASTPAERAAQAERDVAQMMEVYGPACSKMGYKRDEDKWRDCVLGLAIKDENRLNATRYYPMTTTCFGHRGFLDCTSF